MKFLIFLYLFQLIFSSDKATSDEKIVTIGGSITDIVFALGMGERVVAVDQSSTLPEKVKSLPQVGYVRSISAEGILSMSPTKILASSDIGPPNVIDQLRQSGVEFKIFKSPMSFNDVFSTIDSISIFLKVYENGLALREKLEFDLNKIKEFKSSINSSDFNIAFFMNPSSSSFNAAGSGTRASYLIDFIGGSNVYENSFKRYNKVNKEAIISSNPDIILIGSMYADPKENCVFMDDPIFSIVNAVKNQKVIYIDLGYHLTFGSSFGEASLLLINLISNDMR